MPLCQCKTPQKNKIKPRLDNKDEATPQTTYAANARLSSAIKMLIDF